MDGVATAISLATSGYTAYKTVDTTRKEFKRAPDKLQSLDDTRNLIKQLLERLTASDEVGSTRHISPEHVERLRESAQRCFDDIDVLSTKVTKEGSSTGGATKRSIRPFKWLLNKDDIKDTSEDLKELRELLISMLFITQSSVVVSLSNINDD